jgi:hypothetical protein
MWYPRPGLIMRTLRRLFRQFDPPFLGPNGPTLRDWLILLSVTNL